ncbi:DUF6626 family protein [Salinarimonas sp.]|uniref:DUF6626 family protein n=1 Tax=Salinarimonas sp. TaxID=2766526 RepID=UPI0032D91CA9
METLVAHNLVSSEREFSRDWLGRSESYMRGLRFHNKQPSVSSIAVCASKLQHYGERLAQTGMHEELSKRFIQLSEACHRYINAESTASWLMMKPGQATD